MVRLLAPTAAFACLAAPSVAGAEPRGLTRAYEYNTEGAGDTELAFDSTQTRSSFDDGSPQAFDLGLTLAHGITERTDVALTHQLAQTTGAGTPADPGSPLRLREVRVRARHRFAERGDLPVDTTAMVEAGKLFGASVYRGEARVIAARDLGLVTVVLNPWVSVQLGDDVPATDVEVGWAGGATVEIAAELRAGAECWGAVDVDDPDELVVAAGPALSWAPTPSLWVTATAGFGLGDRTEDFSLRALIGVLL